MDVGLLIIISLGEISYQNKYSRFIFSTWISTTTTYTTTATPNKQHSSDTYYMFSRHSLTSSNRRTLFIPNFWKVSRIVPILKTGNPNKQGSSFRPLSLLSPVAKLMEKLILPTMNEHLQPAEDKHAASRTSAAPSPLYNEFIKSGMSELQ